MPHRYSSERRINKAKTKKRKSRKQKKVRNSRKMRKSRKNKYYSQNQEGGWPSLPLFSIFGRKTSVHPISQTSANTIRPPPTIHTSANIHPPASTGHDQSETQSLNLSEEEIKQRREERIKRDIDFTIQDIKAKRKSIQELLQTEDEDVLKYLPTSVEYDYDYAGNINPLTIDNNIQDKQTYLDKLKEEYIKTSEYSTMLKDVVREYRVKKVIDNEYKEPNSLYNEEILSNKAKIISIRTDIKELLPLLKRNISSMNRQDFDRVLNLRKEYNGALLPRTVPQAIHYKESELIKLKEELIRTQTDLKKLETLIESPIQPPPSE